MIRNVKAAASTKGKPALAILGEFFVDLVFYNLPCTPRMGKEVKTNGFSRFPGGGLATTALVAAGLGTPTSVFTRIGRDAPSSPVWQKLPKEGISVGGCEIDARLPTAMTICAAFDGDRMMITHDPINANLERLLAHDLRRRAIRKATHLHLACALRPPRTWVPAIRGFRKHGLTISADIGWNPEVLESQQLPDLLKECEFVFPNEVEARAMTGERSIERAARKLARSVAVAVIKLGEDGSLAARNGEVLRVRSMRVRALDATGAGDAFNGGFLHGYLAGWPLEDCLKAGNVCGALATTQPGGSSAIPSRKELRKLMKRL